MSTHYSERMKRRRVIACVTKIDTALLGQDSNRYSKIGNEKFFPVYCYGGDRLLLRDVSVFVFQVRNKNLGGEKEGNPVLKKTQKGDRIKGAWLVRCLLINSSGRSEGSCREESADWGACEKGDYKEVAQGTSLRSKPKEKPPKEPKPRKDTRVGNRLGARQQPSRMAYRPEEATNNNGGKNTNSQEWTQAEIYISQK